MNQDPANDWVIFEPKTAPGWRFRVSVVRPQLRFEFEPYSYTLEWEILEPISPEEKVSPVKKDRHGPGLTPISEILPAIVKPDIYKPPTRAQQKLINAGVDIRLDPDAMERAYLAQELVQCTLPHSDPGDVQAWTRRNGFQLLTLQPGWDAKKGVSIGYPYGNVPRLLLFWLTTEVVQDRERRIREDDRRIELGSKISEFMRQLGLNPDGGGKNSPHQRLRKQMVRLFRCRISFDLAPNAPSSYGEPWLDMEVGPKGHLWWNPKRPEDETLLGSWVELGKDFFQAITTAPVPSDMRALRALQRSSLALDLYVWSTHKALSVSKKGKPQFVPWRGLHGQFGADYSDPKNFRKKAIAALKKIQEVYPGLQLQDAEGGITVLASSRPAIPPL